MKKFNTNFIGIYLFLGSFLIPVVGAVAQSKNDQIADLIQLYYEQGKFNGSALAAHNGEIVFKGGYGQANMEWDIPNEPDTKHRLGSITKQFTAMIILQLMEAGKVELHVPITKYLSDYPAETGNKITLHHLMTHTSGIPNYTNFPNFFKDKSRDFYSPEEFVKEFDSLPLDFEPGTKYSYSNSAYFLLGAIIEKVTSLTYAEALHSFILGPLGMTDSGFDLHETILKNRAAGYDQNGQQFRNTAYLDMSLPYAAGSMYSTVEDLYKWDRALYTEKLVKNASLKMMFTNHTNGLGSDYGYGFGVGEVPIGDSGFKMNAIAHGGGINGFNTFIVRLPETESLIVLLNNTGGKPLQEIASSIAAMMHNKSYAKPRESIAMALKESIDQKGVAAAQSSFESLQSSGKFSLDENDMNRLGYLYLGEGQTEKAAAVFKINMETFPNSFNVYDSYAEAMMTMKRKDEAIKFYKKSLEMNPGNQNGKDMLAKLGVDLTEVNKKVEVPDDVLSSYVGKYELMPGFILTITKEGNQLIAQATGQPTFKIEPTSQERFFVEEVNAQLLFNKNDSNEVTSVTLFQGGRELEGKKTE